MRRETTLNPEDVKAAWEEGLSDQEIADRVKYSSSWVAKVRLELGLPPNRKYSSSAYVSQMDSQEDIDMCLNCTKKHCDGSIKKCRAALEVKREFYM